MSVVAKNPILPGFFPDPSACVVGDDIYIVNSTFAYFPGLPILHSKDLAHWEQIGNVLTRESQLPLKNAGVSNGLFAPTIRYNKGKFYVICTNVTFGGNFIVTADSIDGPWSEPHYLEGADGIDPSLFFDEDGKCYYIGTHPNPDGCKYDGDWYIYIRELDIENFKFKGEAVNVWNGAMRGVHWPEGPHLYHIGDYYYILHAEGGTGPEHAVSVARSKTVFGPYEGNFCNPILTHRHLGSKYPVKYVGHADMFMLPSGDWYMVMLAVRPAQGKTTMGRETFLARVIWENGWPVVNPNVGCLTNELVVKADDFEREYASTSYPNGSKNYDFTQMEKLGPEWLSLRDPFDKFGYVFRRNRYEELKEDENSIVNKLNLLPGLNLKCGKKVTGIEDISYVAVRQNTHMFEASTCLYNDNLNTGASAGIIIYQNNRFNLRIEIKNWIAYIIRTRNGEESKIASYRLSGTFSVFSVQIIGLRASFYIREGREVKPIAEYIDISDLSTEVAGGFVGCTVGLFAQDDNEEREAPVYANFREFDYNLLDALKID